MNPTPTSEWDKNAWHQFADETYLDLLRYACGLCYAFHLPNASQEAADLLQTSWETVKEKVENEGKIFDSATHVLFSLKKTLLNHLRNHKRWSRRWGGSLDEPLPGEWEDDAPTQILQIQDDAPVPGHRTNLQPLRACIETLAPNDRDLIYQAPTGAMQPAVRVRLFRLRKALKACLEKKGFRRDDFWS